MANDKKPQRKGGLGRGLGALIPTAEPVDAGADGNPLDVLFPNLQGTATVEPRGRDRGGSAKDLLKPRQREVGKRKTVSRETISEALPNVSRETTTSSTDQPHDVSRETITSADGLIQVPGATFLHLPLVEIVANTKQPRQIFEQSDLDELADSIEQVGLLQPIVVRPVQDSQPGDPRFEIIMGERRFRATQQLGLDTIPAIVRSTADEDLLRDALLENLHRTNLNPLEEAAAYSQLLVDFDCTQDELSSRIARSRPQIANTLRLLKLPASVQRLVSAEVLSAGHARALLGLSSKTDMDDLAERIVEEGLSVRMTEDLVRRIRQDGALPRVTPRKPPTVSELALRTASVMAEALDTQVTVKEGKGRGRIVIDFADSEDLQRISAILTRRGSA